MPLRRRSCWLLLALSFIALMPGSRSAAQAAAGPSTTGQAAPKQKVILDTDIGDDVDDAFAVGLALASSDDFEILGITTAWGNTALRARLLDRLLCETGRSDLPVAIGMEKHKAGEGAFSQARWAERGQLTARPDAPGFLLDLIRKNPGEITLIGLAPLTNIGAAIARDPATFRKLKRVVIMGGSVRAGYDDLGYTPSHGPSAEYNITMDVAAAQQLFTSGVPLYVMPLDSTQIKLDEYRRNLLFAQGTPLTDALTLLYAEWSQATHNPTPTMFDAVAVAYALNPKLCPTQPLRLHVDGEGYTREEPGAPNSEVCLVSDSDAFFRFAMPRWMDWQPAAACNRTR